MTERPLSTWIDHLRGRLPVALGVALLGAVARVSTPAPPARTADAIAGMLGDAIGGAVSPDDFVWEERGGFLSDALLGRRVLFLGVPRPPDGEPAPDERGAGPAPDERGAGPAAGAGPAPAERAPDGRGAADLYRARVRLTRSGRPVSLGGVRNLTDTPLGDDRNLVARGSRVAVTTSAFGVVQGITLLDLGGAPGSRPLGERLRAALDGWLETGSADGASRTEIVFDTPPASARLDLVDEGLVMALGPEAVPAALNAGTGEVDTGGRDPFGARAHHLPRRAPSFLELAGPSAGRLLGPGAAAAVERLALAAGRAAAGVRPAPAAAYLTHGAAAPEPAPEGWPSLWPPPQVEPAIQPPLPGEGDWVLVAPSLPRVLPGVEGDPQRPSSPFAATTLRPDPQREHVRVHLLAIDTRHVKFTLQAGFEAPRPTVGPHGTGRLPDAAALRGAIGLGVGARGPAAPPAGAGALGMVVGGRALVPPRDGAATIGVDLSGRPYFGAWPSGGDVARVPWALWQGPPAATPRDLRDGGGRRFPWALWQGPSLFEAAGPASPAPALPALAGPPAERAPAGAALPPGDGDELVVERSALCMTDRGLVIHAWSGAADAAAMRAALERARCVAGVSLGRAPDPLGVAFLSRREDGGLVAERLAPEMSLAPPAHVAAASPGPFLYFESRSTDGPPAPDLSLPGERVGWAADGGAQPPPAWSPAVYAASAVHLGAQVRLHAFAPDRFLFRLRAGSREISPRTAPKLDAEVPADERARVMAAIGVGTGRRRGPRGLAVGGTVGLRFRGEGGLLLVRGGRVEIRPAGGVEIGSGTDATELPLTADDGRLRPEAREIGTMRRRSAACALDDGTLLVATTTFDSDEATTEALLDLGCARVVALDRGAHRNAYVHRAAGDPALQPAYEETALFAVGLAMPGRARRLTEAARP
ncbi:hypothetical protein [Sorangium cellulosum]|uniref:hypothetical protein n=1 Tax=Sorangium cellulosum TaxID=56 RepID=UPI0003F60655|nr:hypothetical protein [Sorangium cellulosum]